MNREEFKALCLKRDEIINGLITEFEYMSQWASFAQELREIISTIDRYVVPEKTQKELDEEWFNEEYR